MSEKVLGFKEKDVSDLIWTECGTGKQTILVYTSPHASEVAKGKKLQTYREVELVPVVSLEWLEKWCKKKEDYFKENDMIPVKLSGWKYWLSVDERYIVGYRSAVNDLLKEAKKGAGEK